jgi:hypothetical protein
MGMVRRRRKHRSTFSEADWADLTVSPPQIWPHVIRPDYQNYDTILKPQGHGFDDDADELLLSRLNTILQVGSLFAIDRIHALASSAFPAAPTISGDFPREPSHPGEPPSFPDQPQWSQFAPKKKALFLSRLFDVLSGGWSRREDEAKRLFKAASDEWERNRYRRESAERTYEHDLERYQKEIADYRTRHDAIMVEQEQATDEHLTKKRKFEEDKGELGFLLEEAKSGSQQGIEYLAAQLFRAIPMPLAIGRDVEARFDPTDGVLLYTLSLPDLEKVRLVVGLATKTRGASPKEIRAAQEFLVHALPLRLIHEVFATPALQLVKFVGVNVRLSFTNRSNGRQMNEIVGSVAAARDEFASINIAEVDPKLCFRSLKGIASPSFQELSAVRPILAFDKSDKRIIQGREVVDKLEAETNLAAMNWEDFEHVVRELFSKMFSARNEAAEVHVTRASRDYGVDAIVHDPDPIHGGKFVIQAKRYVNTVEVAAVRDLLGRFRTKELTEAFWSQPVRSAPMRLPSRRGSP